MSANPNASADTLSASQQQLLTSVQQLKDAHTELMRRYSAATDDADRTNIMNELEKNVTLRASLLSSAGETALVQNQAIATKKNDAASAYAIASLIQAEKQFAQDQAEEIQDIRNNKQRMIQLNTYYGKRFMAQAGVMKIFIYMCIPILILAVLANMGFLPNYIAGFAIIAGTNEAWQEVWWMYPSADSNTPNRYVIFNYNEKIWYYGNIDRTGWLDAPSRNFPLAVNTAENSNTGYLYYQENGIDADGVAMDSYILSNDFDIGDGEQFMLTRRLIPDINFSGSTAASPEVQIQIRPRRFPGNPATDSATDQKSIIETAANTYTEQVYIRARARQMAMRIGSTGLGVQWQLGAPRLDARADGKR